MTTTSTITRVSRMFCLLALIATATLTGCQTPSTNYTADSGKADAEPLTLREGDTVQIDFPGAPNLNKVETIKRDGKISLLVGEVTAAGKTIAQLQKELLELYKDQLVTKVVTVSLQSSQYPVYVTGAVGKPGRLTFDRPMTALETVMEAGVDVTRGNLKSVRVTRNVSGKTEVFMLDLDRVLKGKSKDGELPFYVKPSDIIYVPEKFQWF
ncbi:MAG TPA: polysaccharide biosynthesis/export family protein [Candidatus Paceibacterota bacterium]|nr:polysaccharide biosynthesis/export family protein [Candidatus Paceibacterota bacterium]